MSQSNQPYLTDRSRTIAYQTCNRLRYWQYEWGGRGLSVQRSSIPFTVGSAVHRGLESILEWAMQLGSRVTPDENVIDVGVSKALEQYDSDCRERGLEIHEGEDSGYVYFEQRALIEAMLRGWCVARLPSFLEEYDVVEVEREEELQLVEGILSNCDICDGFGHTDRAKINTEEAICPACGGTGSYRKGGIIFMARADGLLCSRSSGDLYVLSFKTAAKYDERTARDNRYDMQGMSELAAIEARLERWYKAIGTAIVFGPQSGMSREQTAQFLSTEETTKDIPSWFVDYILATSGAPKIMGVQMEYLLKGERFKEYEAGSYSGPYRQNSPLIRPYMKQGILSTSDSFAWKFQYQDDYGANKRLGKGWSRANIWEVMTIKEWIELLATGEVQPEAGDCLTAQFVSPPVIYRQEDEVRDFLEQITQQEQEIRNARMELETGDEQLDKSYLNRYFPQHRRSCSWPIPCQFIALCHEGLGDNPLGSGLYKLRQPHHQREIERFQNNALDPEK